MRGLLLFCAPYHMLLKRKEVYYDKENDHIYSLFFINAYITFIMRQKGIRHLP